MHSSNIKDSIPVLITLQFSRLLCMKSYIDEFLIKSVNLSNDLSEFCWISHTTEGTTPIACHIGHPSSCCAPN